jgi:hypothetical protein
VLESLRRFKKNLLIKKLKYQLEKELKKKNYRKVREEGKLTD